MDQYLLHPGLKKALEKPFNIIRFSWIFVGT